MTQIDADTHDLPYRRHLRRPWPANSCRWNARRREERRARTTSGRSTSARSTRPRTPPCAWSSRSTARRVVKAVPDIGYLHSGFEKLGEDLDYNQYVTIVDRMNYISPIANEIAWHHAVEKLMGIELTPRCKYLRVILARAGPHQRPPALRRRRRPRPRGVHRLPLRLQPAREDLRHLRDRVRPALPPELDARRRPDVRRQRRVRSARSATSSRTFPKAHADIVRLLNRNRIFVDRTQGIGVLTKEEAIT